MTIDYDRTFVRHFKIRIKPNRKLHTQFNKRLVMFENNPAHPLLRDHQLKGSRKAYRAFSITGDIRVVYVMEDDDRAIFIDIGTHNQVYK